MSEYFAHSSCNRHQHAREYWSVIVNLPCSKNLTVEDIDRVFDALTQEGSL